MQRQCFFTTPVASPPGEPPGMRSPGVAPEVEGGKFSHSRGISLHPRLQVVLMTVACWLLFALASPAALETADGEAEGRVIRTWGTEAGLPQNTVNAVLQTRDGYLWIGTRDGLARFDGVRFTVFGLRDGLRSVEVLTLFEDREGDLWIGTGGGGVARLRNGRIESLALPQPQLTGTSVTALTEDHRGRLWIGTRAGLNLWQAGRYVQDPALNSLEQVPISALLCDRSGGVWISTATRGLFEYRDGRLAPSPGPSGNESILAYCLLEDQQGALWASVGNGVILCRRGGVWGKYDQADGVPYAYVATMAEEADGTVWAGSLDAGLYYFEAGRFHAITKRNGLSGDDIRSIRADREGNLWVGTRTAGLNRLSRRKLVSCGPRQGLTNDFTRSVAETADGTLWVGTIGGGLYRGTPQRLEPFAPETVVSTHPFVESVLAARDGSLWWGVSRGLFCWKDGRLTGNYTNQVWLLSAAVTALCDDGESGIWVGTSEGRLAHFYQGKFTEFPRSIAGGAITAFARERQPGGVLWVGSAAGGLYSVRRGSEIVFSITNGLSSQSIRTLYLDDAGTLWIGTAGGGLGRCREDRVVCFTSGQGLGADTVSQIVEDDFGCLWLGSNRGVFRIPKKDLNDLAAGRISFLHPRAFGVNEGMPIEECSSGFCPAGLKTKSGLVCFSTLKGLVFLDPRQQETNHPPPAVLLEEVLVNGHPFAMDAPRLGEASEGGEAEAGYEHRCQLSAGAREVELHFTGISFASPEKVRFRYRLEGVDRDWIEAGTRRVAFYQRVPAGVYTFHVTACNADGVWSEPAALLALTVRPYLWETAAFQVGVGVLGIGLVAGLLRYVERRRFKRQLALLETQHAIEKERLRISQDMHDDIGGILTQVSQLSELGQSEAGGQGVRAQFERIGQQARAAVQGLDEIVWATNPKNDNLVRFAEYVCRFADEFFESSSVRCWQEVPTQLPDWPLRADVRHDVFLAVKEAFNNVLKHSGATEVWLRLALGENGVRLEIEDNGRGFVPGKGSRTGNGIENMRHRLMECGGGMELVTAPNQGTRIVFAFSLTPPGAIPS